MKQISRERLSSVLITVFNCLTTLIGIIFFGWKTDTVICYYWMEIWMFAFFNIFKTILIARSEKSEFIDWFFLGMFGVVALIVTNICLAVILEPDFGTLNDSLLVLLILFAAHSGNFIGYIRTKRYLENSGGVMEGLRFANKAAVSLVFIVLCSVFQDAGPELGPDFKAMAGVVILIVVRTFFDLRGGFLKTE